MAPGDYSGTALWRLRHHLWIERSRVLAFCDWRAHTYTLKGTILSARVGFWSLPLPSFKASFQNPFEKALQNDALSKKWKSCSQNLSKCFKIIFLPPKKTSHLNIVDAWPAWCVCVCSLSLSLYLRNVSGNIPTCSGWTYWLICGPWTQLHLENKGKSVNTESAPEHRCKTLHCLGPKFGPQHELRNSLLRNSSPCALAEARWWFSIFLQGMLVGNLAGFLQDFFADPQMKGSKNRGTFQRIFLSSQTWLFQTWLFAIFTRMRSFVLSCALLRSFALFCGLAFALFCGHLRSFCAHLAVRVSASDHV